MTAAAERFTGVVLAGGASRRMGMPKATLVIDGSTLVARVADALREAGADEVVVVGGPPADAVAADARSEADRWPGEGPLGGIISALMILPDDGDVAVVAACDLPDIEASVVRSLLEALGADPSLDAVVPVVDGRRQPLLAAYRRRCVDALGPAFASGERRLDAALRVLVLHEPAAEGRSFTDLDTPDELALRRDAQRISTQPPAPTSAARSTPAPSAADDPDQ